MKVVAMAMVAMLIALTVAGCARETPSTTADQIIKKISAAEANTLIQANAGKSDFVLLDVRTPTEFAAGHLEAL